jgi:hypothetical protein
VFCSLRWTCSLPSWPCFALPNFCSYFQIQNIGAAIEYYPHPLYTYCLKTNCTYKYGSDMLLKFAKSFNASWKTKIIGVHSLPFLSGCARVNEAINRHDLVSSFLSTSAADSPSGRLQACAGDPFSGPDLFRSKSWLHFSSIRCKAAVRSRSDLSRFRRRWTPVWSIRVLVDG